MKRTMSLAIPLAVAACASPAVAPAPPPVCHEPAPHTQRAVVFVGELIATKDDDESGYAHAIRSYAFRPIMAWRGVTRPDPIAVAAFLPNAEDHYALPRFETDERVFVVADMDGMAGTMLTMNRDTVSAVRAEGRIATLGTPCWKR